ncbi:MAG: Pyridoxamine 5-phosphate oxidase [Gemmatimonadetes bacterium]|nr:Pyridoxamine 5-phosphate oxidase [Gemmatimonadota bacterium]
MTTSDTIPADPIARFSELLGAATRLDRSVLPEPTAFTLATVSPQGQPSARILLLKHVDDRGFVFYTNLESRKGRELLWAGRAAMCFHWQLLERQVRVEGTVEQVSDEEADAYFASRARGSQLGAWASLQSQPMESPSDLDARVAEFEARFADGPVPRPLHWSGFRLVPVRIEFWHNMPSRLHQRHLYERDGSAWRTSLLYP